MVQEISNGISVSVETFYQEDQSRPLQNLFLFAYRITIENITSEPVKLLRRHWYIFDSVGVEREVEGEGVVGQQPIIAPNEVYQYISGCQLQTDMGRMHGYYIFERKTTLKMIAVNIPKFELIAPQKMN